MIADFYDNVARKFGGYKTGYRHVTEYPHGNPEEIFKDKLVTLSGGDVRVLDVGCAGGRFTLSIAPNFKKIIAIDLLTRMLKLAKQLQKKLGIKNVSFEKQDAFHTPYRNDSFDVVYSRRGPSPLAETFRLLRTGGQYVELSIGERDCMELKMVFGRGQNYGKWNERRMDWVKREAGGIGFETVFADEFMYDEFYLSYEDVDLFLQGFQIFEDFDSKKDKRLLKKYAFKYNTPRGVRLQRHRVVSVFKKPGIDAQAFRGFMFGMTSPLRSFEVDSPYPLPKTPLARSVRTWISMAPVRFKANATWGSSTAAPALRTCGTPISRRTPRPNSSGG